MGCGPTWKSCREFAISTTYTWTMSIGFWRVINWIGKAPKIGARIMQRDMATVDLQSRNGFERVEWNFFRVITTWNTVTYISYHKFLKQGLFSKTYSVLLDATPSSFICQWFTVVSPYDLLFSNTGSEVQHQEQRQTCAMKAVRKHLIR